MLNLEYFQNITENNFHTNEWINNVCISLREVDKSYKIVDH